MKVLCLSLFLANLSLILWEYRSGAFTKQTENQMHYAIAGKEQIFLAHELNNKAVAPPPKAEPLPATYPYIPEYKVKEMQAGSIEHANTTFNKQADTPFQLP
jgi:hypothetical protein